MITTKKSALLGTWNKCGFEIGRMKFIFVITAYLLMSFQESSCKEQTHDDEHTSDVLHHYHNLQNLMSYKKNTDYEIVLPYQVDSNGLFVSHTLNPLRQRRYADGRVVPSITNYKFRAYDEDFHLELTTNKQLLAPGFSIQSLRNGQIEFKDWIPGVGHCNYQGTLKSHPGSTVAVSLCDGLVGLVQTNQEDYLIEPLPEHLIVHHNLSLLGGQKPHMLYKRSIVNGHPQRHKAREKGRSADQGRGHRPASNLTKQHFCGPKKRFQPHAPEKPIFWGDEFEAPHNPEESRHKRAITGNIHRNRYIETLVVVDNKMISNHGEEKITAYVLTIFNMVTSLYKDVTLGNTINMVLVSLLLLHDDQPGLNIDHHADHSLNSFCQWQSTLTTPNGTQHDHAILLTGMDICSWKNEPCDTLGFAPIGGMCSKYRSCTINEDTGLGLAFTVAHESGHSFGMVHDGDGNECKKSSGYIMSPTLSGNNGRFHWSPCSQQYIADFLSSSRARCTEDEPIGITKYQFPSMLPGQLYDADKQCQWQFGPRARLCSFNFGKSLCQSIWCHRDERRCETKFLPAADGTPCGNEEWCIQGNCVNRSKKGPLPIHGSWSDYGHYSSCSRTCGGGIQFKERHCNQPEPQNGGKYCEGPSHIYRMCSIHECGPNTVDFRAKQCASFNSRPFRGAFYEWQPYVHTDRKEACKLYCMADGFDFYFPLSSKVHDGTRCSHDSLDTCVNGVCQKVGCDHVLGSDAKPDACGVCQGDNSTCNFVKGTYTEQHTENDYYVIVKIPANARRIKISELSTSSSYLALRNQRYRYYLTGAWTVDWPGNFDIAGTLFEYRRPFDAPEYLQALGPTNEDLVVEVLLQGVNPGIEYEYTVQTQESQAVGALHNYTWLVVESECSASCAGGVMTTQLFCMQDNILEVDNSFCDNSSMPKIGVFTCSLQPCLARWDTKEWSECSRSCGTGRQKRQVKCMRKVKEGVDKSVKESHCAGPKPRRRRNCNMQDCPARWIPEPWSDCSVTCGMGRRSRLIRCSFLDRQGQYREVENTECKHLDRPSLATTKPCHRGLCLSSSAQTSAKWRTTSWTECTKTCGGGTKTRKVHCFSNGRRTSQVNCSLKNKPTATLMCNSESCPVTLPPVCVDQYNWCYLVPQHNMCGHNFYGPKCCYSCK